jgi:hypothetical protein
VSQQLKHFFVEFWICFIEQALRLFQVSFVYRSSGTRCHAFSAFSAAVELEG